MQRLLWIPGIGRIGAFTMLLEVDGIARVPSARDVVSSCRLVPGASNSGGKTRHTRTTDGNRSLTLAFSHAAVRAKSITLRRTEKPQWPRLASPSVSLEPSSRDDAYLRRLDWEARRCAAENLWDRSSDREPAMVYGRH